MAEIHGTWLKYLRNGCTMLEMAKEFDKRFKYVGKTYTFGNGLSI